MAKKLQELKTEQKSDTELLHELILALQESNAILEEGHDELLAAYNKFLKIKNAARWIDNSDRVFAAMVQIDLEIDKSFQSIGQLNILVNMQNPQMTKLWLPKINKTEENLLRIIDTEFADDASTHALKQKAYGFVQEIRRLKDML